MLRRIIQIIATSNPDLLYALCTDGTVWYKISGTEWRLDTKEICQTHLDELGK